MAIQCIVLHFFPLLETHNFKRKIYTQKTMYYIHLNREKNNVTFPFIYINLIVTNNLWAPTTLSKLNSKAMNNLPLKNLRYVSLSYTIMAFRKKRMKKKRKVYDVR